MTDVIDFLKLNGFEEIEEGYYGNDLCAVEFNQWGGYTVANNRGEEMFSDNLSIYWLIGVLTYYGYMPKHYNQA